MSPDEAAPTAEPTPPEELTQPLRPVAPKKKFKFPTGFTVLAFVLLVVPAGSCVTSKPQQSTALRAAAESIDGA